MFTGDLRMTEKTLEIDANMAFLKAQQQMGYADKDRKNPHFKSTYSTLLSVTNAVKGPLNDNGIYITHYTHYLDNIFYVGTRLVHAPTGKLVATMEIPTPIGKMQELGSAVSYAKRYTLQAVCAIPSDDDDGHKAQSLPEQKKSEAKGLTQDQKTKLYALMQEYGWDQQKVVDAMKNVLKISSTNDITLKQFEFLCNLIKGE
jgi:hypothetical protein